MRRILIQILLIVVATAISAWATPQPGGMPYDQSRVSKAKALLPWLNSMAEGARQGRWPAHSLTSRKWAQFQIWCNLGVDDRVKLTAVAAYNERALPATGTGTDARKGRQGWNYTVWVVDMFADQYRYSHLVIDEDGSGKKAIRFFEQTPLRQFLDPSGRHDSDQSIIRHRGVWPTVAARPVPTPVSDAIQYRDPGNWTPRTSFEGMPAQQSFIHKGYWLVRLVDLPKSNPRRVAVERFLADARTGRWQSVKPYFAHGEGKSIDAWCKQVLPALKGLKADQVKVTPFSFRQGNDISFPVGGRRYIFSCCLPEEGLSDSFHLSSMEYHDPLARPESEYFTGR